MRGVEEGDLDERILYTLPVIIFGIVAIAFAAWLARDVMAKDTGTDSMQDIENRIFQGALAYLNRQYRTIGVLSVFVADLIGVLVATFEKEHEVARGVITSIAFLYGAALSGLSGFIGMYVAVRSNVRTAAAARRSLGEALTVALRGGAVSGFLVIALGLVGIMTMYYLVYFVAEGVYPAVAETPFWIVGFAFGASFVALFAQLGGGIYTKAANVGDCAGRGADLFESSAAEIIGAMILGVALFQASGGDPESGDVAWIFFPL